MSVDFIGDSLYNICKGNCFTDINLWVLKVAKNLELAYLIDIYGPLLTKKQLEVIELYYFEDFSLAEIAEHSGISRQGVRDAIKRGEEILSESEKCLGFAQRYKGNIVAIEEIEMFAKEILLYNNKYSYSNQIREFAEEIIRKLKNIEV